MRSSAWILAGSACALALSAAHVACSAFGGEDTPPPANGTDGSAGDGAADATDVSIDGGAGFTPSLVDASGDPGAPPGPSPCNGNPAVLFCDDFEQVSAPAFGFMTRNAPAGSSVDVVRSGDGATNLLRVTIDTTNVDGGPAGVSLVQAFKQPAAKVTLEYDIFVAASPLAYSTYGVLDYASAPGNEEVGVGGDAKNLGQPRGPFSGKIVTEPGWHHVVAVSDGSKALQTASVDGVTVQQQFDDAGIVPNAAQVIIGITECSAVLPGLQGDVIVYYDNVVLK